MILRVNSGMFQADRAAQKTTSFKDEQTDGVRSATVASSLPLIRLSATSQHQSYLSVAAAACFTTLSR